MDNDSILYNTFAEINLDAILHNFREIKNYVQEDISIMGIVKANGYGHGAVEVGKVLVNEGVSILGVATVMEGVELKRAGISIPILVLGGVQNSHTEAIVKYDLSQTAFNIEIISYLSKFGYKYNKRPKVHIKIDTGMGRIGIRTCEELNYFLWELKKYKNIEVEGVYTHFSSSDGLDRNITYDQVDKFNECLRVFDKHGINYQYSHCSNSAAIISFPELNSVFNIVRPGLILYGYYPSEYCKDKIYLRPALQLKTRITHIKTISRGESVGYGRTYTAVKDIKVATIGTGFGDGYNRKLSNKGDVIVKDKKAPIIGRISMDQSCIDISDIEDVSVGDEVILIGNSGDISIWADDIGGLDDSIAAEVLVMLGKRVLRVYKNDNDSIEMGII